MTMPIEYEILALRYGIFDGRMQYQNVLVPDDHAAPEPLDFYVFAIKGGGRTIVMDTGFNPVSAGGGKVIRLVLPLTVKTLPTAGAAL